MRIKQLRTAGGISQETLAKKAKISREYVNKLGAGRYDPTLDVLQRLAKALKTTVGELVE